MTLSNDIGPTEHVARFVAVTALADVPETAIAGAKLLMLDTIGVALAGLNQGASRSVLDYVMDSGGNPGATVIGSGHRRAPAQMAALANGVFMNVLDYDGFWHVPTHVLPAVLAVGEMVGAPGEAVLAAYIVGCEAASRMREVIDARRSERGGPTYRGWYHVSIYGPIAAAFAAGKLMGFGADQLRAAAGLAANAAGGFRQNLGTSAKSLLSGNSASLGVQSALLAKRGIAGDPTILEARVGLFNALCLPGECDLTPLMSHLGKPYELAGGLGLKAFPSVGPTQCVIGSLQQMKKAHYIEAEKVDWVELGVASFSAGQEYPTDGSQAGFSWPYIIAATLVDDRFSVEHLSIEKLGDDRIRAMSSRIRLKDPGSNQQEYISIGLKGGDVVHWEVDPELGRLESAAAILEKYHACARFNFPDYDSSVTQDLVMRIEDLESLDEVMASLP